MSGVSKYGAEWHGDTVNRIPSKTDAAALLRFVNLINLELDDFASYQQLVIRFKEELKEFIQW
jgi:hypothetical protein